jgi:hypothetical protein
MSSHDLFRLCGAGLADGEGQGWRCPALPLASGPALSSITESAAMPLPRSTLLLLFCLAGAPAALAQALVLRGLPEAEIRLDRAALEKLGVSEVTDAREVTTATGRERIEVVYRGVELAKLLAAHGIERLDRRGVRAATIQVIAKDGYRASFSWGELFNTAGGNRVFVITGERGPATNPNEGAFSLRAFADLRPGPRHVRDVAEIVVELPR